MGTQHSNNAEQTKQEETKEVEWMYPQRNRPQQQVPYEFVTRFGVTHLGYCTTPSRGNDQHQGRVSFISPDQLSSIIFVAESDGLDQYFAVDQIEKYRLGKRFPKNRLVGICRPEHREHLGIQSEMFIGHLYLRLKEKYPTAALMDINDTVHSINSEDLQYWTTHFQLSRGQSFIITEFKDSATFDIDTAPGFNNQERKLTTYSYKDVATAVEDVLDAAFQEK